MILDIAFGILLLSYLMRGYRRGFLGEVVSVGGFVLGIMFAGNLVRLVGSKVEPYLDRVPQDIRPAVLHLGAIVVIMLLVWIIGGILFGRNREKMLGLSGPSPIDRFSGATLGLAVGAVIVCLIVAGLGQLPNQIRDQEIVKSQIEQSKGVKYAEQIGVARWVAAVPEVQVAMNYTSAVFHRVTSDHPVDEESLERAAKEIFQNK
ncbi:CvpA family protein [bacterium]|nr:CvpA family protein [bacterium]